MRVKIAQPSAKTVVTQLELVGLRRRFFYFLVFLFSTFSGLAKTCRDSRRLDAGN